MFGIASFAAAPYAALGEVVVVVALSGVAATGNVGTVTSDVTVALSGVSASGNTGTVTATGSQGETGDVAYGYVDTVTPSVTVDLSGVCLLYTSPSPRDS